MLVMLMPIGDDERRGDGPFVRRRHEERIKFPLRFAPVEYDGAKQYPLEQPELVDGRTSVGEVTGRSLRQIASRREVWCADRDPWKGRGVIRPAVRMLVIPVQAVATMPRRAVPSFPGGECRCGCPVAAPGSSSC